MAIKNSCFILYMRYAYGQRYHINRSISIVPGRQTKKKLLLFKRTNINLSLNKSTVDEQNWNCDSISSGS